MSHCTTQHDEDALCPDHSPPDVHTRPEDAADGELRVVIRKLEVPVRPRGVLAE